MEWIAFSKGLGAKITGYGALAGDRLPALHDGVERMPCWDADTVLAMTVSPERLQASLAGSGDR